MLHHLPITDGLHRRPVFGKAALQQLFRLPHQTAREHLVHASVDARAQVRAGTCEAEESIRVRRSVFRAPRGALRRKRFVGQANHLERADDAARIFSVDFSKSDRVSLFELTEQFRQRCRFQFST